MKNAADDFTASPLEGISPKSSFVRWGSVVICRALTLLFLVLPSVVEYPSSIRIPILSTLGIVLVLRWMMTPIRSWIDERYSIGLVALLFVAPLIPFWGVAPGIILASLIAVMRPVLDREEGRAPWYDLVFRFPIILFLVAVWFGDLLFAGSVLFRAASAEALVDMLGWDSHSLLVYLPSWKPVSQLCLLFLLVGIFARYRITTSGRVSLLSGALIGGMFTIGQRFIGGDLLLRNQGSFWVGTGRFPGSFSDPNAQGVYLAIALVCAAVPLYVELKQRSLVTRYASVLGIAVVVLFVAALYAGSRSFLVLIILFVGTLSVKDFRHACIGMAITLSVAFLLGTGFELVSGKEQFQQYLNGMPNGLQRLVASLSVLRWEETFFSRSIFLQLLGTSIREFGVWGIGPGAFKHYVPALSVLNGIDLNGWVDNTNNFYLGYLAEYGIVGVLLVGLTVRSFRVDRKVTRIELAGLVAILVLLITGPHIDAIEVAIAYAFCVGSVVKFRDYAEALPHESSVSVRRFKGASRTLRVGDSPPLLLTPIAVGLVGVGAATIQFQREHGGYDWDREGGRYHQWLGQVAQIERSCTCHGRMELIVEVAGAHAEAPTEVTVTTAGGATSTRVYRKAGVQTFTLPCGSEMHESSPEEFHYPRRARTMVQVEASRVWIPARRASRAPDSQQDTRALGARIRFRAPQDEISSPPCP